MNTNLDEIAFGVFQTAKDKGFWDGYEGNFDDDPDKYITKYLAKLALIHSEASEVLEAIRKEQGRDKVVEELSDIIIRILDLWAGMVHQGYTTTGLNRSILDKAEANKSRPRKHGVLA